MLMNLLGLAVVIMFLLVIIFGVNLIFKLIITKKNGVERETTVVKAERDNAKGNVTYTIYCKFEYNGRIIQHIEGGMRDHHNVEDYIGKKYKVLYHPKYDFMVVKQSYKGTVLMSIVLIILFTSGDILLFLALLSDMGYIKF